MSTAKLTPVEISNSIRRVTAANPNMTVKKISKELGLSKSYIYKLLKLTDYKPGPFFGGRVERLSGTATSMDISSAYPDALMHKGRRVDTDISVQT